MKYLLLIALVSSLSLTSCLYRMDIEQGNAIDSTKVEKLSLGMSKKQVLFLLGTPAIKDIYHENKWHYLRSLKHDNGEKMDFKTMVLDFENDNLVKITGSL